MWANHNYRYNINGNYVTSNQQQTRGIFGGWITNNMSINGYDSNFEKCFSFDYSNGKTQTTIYNKDLSEQFHISDQQAELLNIAIKFGVGALIGELTGNVFGWKIPGWLSGGLGEFQPEIPQIKPGDYTQINFGNYTITTGPDGSSLNGIYDPYSGSYPSNDTIQQMMLYHP